MRWFVDISAIGEASYAERYCIEASQWQTALQQGRQLRGDSGPMSKLSIEAAGEGYRATDAQANVRYSIHKAPPDAPLTPVSEGAVPSKPNTVPSSSPSRLPSVRPPAVAPRHPTPLPAMPDSSGELAFHGSVVPPAPRVPDVSVGAGTPAQTNGSSRTARVETQNKTVSASAKPALVSGELRGGPHYGSVTPSAVIPNRIILKREEEPTPGSPICYRECAVAVTEGASDAQVEAVLWARYHELASALADRPKGKFVQLAVFDHAFTGKPQRPPLGTLMWKDWKGEPVVRLGANGKGSLQPGSMPPASLGKGSFPPAAPAANAVRPSTMPPPAPRLASIPPALDVDTSRAATEGATSARPAAPRPATLSLSSRSADSAARPETIPPPAAARPATIPPPAAAARPATIPPPAAVARPATIPPPAVVARPATIPPPAVATRPATVPPRAAEAQQAAGTPSEPPISAPLKPMPIVRIESKPPAAGSTPPTSLSNAPAPVPSPIQPAGVAGSAAPSAAGSPTSADPAPSAVAARPSARVATPAAPSVQPLADKAQRQSRTPSPGSVEPNFTVPRPAVAAPSAAAPVAASPEVTPIAAAPIATSPEVTRPVVSAPAARAAVAPGFPAPAVSPSFPEPAAAAGSPAPAATSSSAPAPTPPVAVEVDVPMLAPAAAAAAERTPTPDRRRTAPIPVPQAPVVSAIPVPPAFVAPTPAPDVVQSPAEPLPPVSVDVGAVPVLVDVAPVPVDVAPVPVSVDVRPVPVDVGSITVSRDASAVPPVETPVQSAAAPVTVDTSASAAESALSRAAEQPASPAEAPVAPLVVQAPGAPAASEPARDSVARVRVAASRRRASEDLIGELFETMHELHFVPDSVTGADFVSRVLLATLPSEAHLIHIFDINRSQFVVVRAHGPHPQRALLHVTPGRDPRFNQIMRKGAPLRLSQPDEGLTGERWSALGVQVQSALCGGVRQAGRYLGVIELANPIGGEPFSDNEAHALQYICEQFADFLAQRPILLDPELIRAGG